LHAFITASIPDVMNINPQMISDFRLQIVTSDVEPIHRKVKTIRDIGLDRIGCSCNGAIHNVPFARGKLREYSIAEVPFGMTPVDADAQSRKLWPDVLDHGFQAVMPPRRPERS
jgi:hypothetical protein